MPPLETIPTAEEVFTYGSPSSTPPDLRLIHYNDVYHLDSSSAEPVGGIARFATVVKDYQDGDRFASQPACLTLFSGDAFNPSLESSITKGSHMVPILNTLNTTAAALGNHDLDFGVTQFRHLAATCTFPWLVANILDPALGPDVPIGHCKRTHLLTTSTGLKVGLIGLGEREWLETINALPPNLIYRSASETARELIPQLRADGADVIIALTHMREPNDIKLAEQVGDQIDLILGGHDHFYSHSFINGCHVLRSGTDFKQLSYLEGRRTPAGSPRNFEFSIVRRDIVASIAEDAPTLALAAKLTAKLKQSLNAAVGVTAAPLDARFTTVRTRESNIGNFVCDVMCGYYGADCALMAAGTIRGDQIYPPGPIRVKDITDCFPFEDPLIVLKVTGRAIREALENAVSMYPALEGRFPQVAKIRFTFDPTRKVGERVTEVDIKGEGYQPDKLYVLATRGYMGRGKDGYKSLLIQAEGGAAIEVVSEENGILISMLLRQYFMSLKVLDRWANLGPHMAAHWKGVASGCQPTLSAQPAAPPTPEETSSSGWDKFAPAARNSRVGPLSEGATDVEEGPSPPREAEGTGETEDDEDDERELAVMRRVFRLWCKRAGVHAAAAEEDERVKCAWTRAIHPKVEGRIVMVGDGGVGA